jgi:hypothetical protein
MRAGKIQLFYTALILAFLALCMSSACRADQILGQVRLHADNPPAKNAGVWVDGKYVGYLDELRGTKKVLLAPGEHDISVREAGFENFDQKIVVRPKHTQTVRVTLLRDPRAQLPMVTGEVKFWILPERAAVFVDDQYAGYAQQFGGPGRGMLLGPGKHRIKITLPGYEPFDSEIEVRANQRYDIHTELLKGSAAENSGNQ